MTCLLAVALNLFLVPPATPQPDDNDIAAPIVYEDLMLVLVNSDGVAAIVFDAPIKEGQSKRGVQYRYRFESRDGKTQKAGEGRVFEQEGENRREDHTLRAGPLGVVWSHGGDGRGWIYYEPEKLRVHIASAKSFKDGTNEFTGTPTKKLDLRRFLK